MLSVRELPRTDVAIAAVLAVYGLAEGVARDAETVWLAGVLAVTLPLAWRREHPVAVTAWILALFVLNGAADGPEVRSVLPLPLIVILGYTWGREATTAARAAAAALAIASVPVLDALTAPAENTVAEDLVALVVVLGGATLAGRLVRVRQEESVQLEQVAARLAQAQDELARAAVQGERARIARELHDVVAHTISLIAVQAAAAEELLERDPARARTSLSAIQDAARGAMTEMRRLLSVLRADEEWPPLSPGVGLSAVPELVERARAAGLPVALQIEGEDRRLPAGLDLSAYRIIQEALTNARKHAGGAPTEVTVRCSPDELLVEVVNGVGGPAGDGEHGGHGLAGMHERVRIYGGELDAGPEGERFVVRARLPIVGARP